VRGKITQGIGIKFNISNTKVIETRNNIENMEPNDLRYYVE